MNELSMKEIYALIRKYAEAIGGVESTATVDEVCDFGAFYGFSFGTKDIFANVYWCVRKEDYQPFTFRPNQDIKKFMGRKVLSIDVIK